MAGGRTLSIEVEGKYPARRSQGQRELGRGHQNRVCELSLGARLHLGRDPSGPVCPWKAVSPASASPSPLKVQFL